MNNPLENATMTVQPDGQVPWWPAYSPNEIIPRLWQGGTEDYNVVGEPRPVDHYARNYPFDLIVTLYADAQPAPWGVTELRYGFMDAGLDSDILRRLLTLAQAAHDAWREGQTVLVRCQAGVNRSGLVTALILLVEGTSAHDAVKLLRARRGGAVLSNKVFEQWLLNHGDEAMNQWKQWREGKDCTKG